MRVWFHSVTVPSAETKGQDSFFQSLNQPTPARFFSLLKYKLWFLSSWRSQRVIYLRCLQHQNHLPQNLWRNLIRYFSAFPLCGARFGLFRVLVFCHRPSFRSFFLAFRLVLVFLPVFIGFNIWGVFSVPRVPWVCSFVTVSFLVSCVFSGVISYSFRAFLCSGVLPLVVAFYFVLFCYILFAVRVRSAPGAHTFFCLFEKRFWSAANDRFLAPWASFWRFFIIYGPGPFWLP